MNHAETTRRDDQLQFHIVEAVLPGRLDEAAQMHLIDKGLTVRSLTGPEMILSALEPFAGTLFGKNGKRSVDVRRPIKVDPNTLKAKGVRRDFSRHVGRLVHLHSVV